MASSIPGAVAALNALLTAAVADGSGSALSGVELAFGSADAYEEQEVVLIGGIDPATEDDAALGGQRQEESFVVTVTVKVYGPEDDGPTVFARAYVLAEGVRAVVNANHTLSNTVRRARVAGMPSPSGAQRVENTAGFVCFVDIAVICVQRVT